jgi:acyl-CoA synthetase (NDP forming)
MRDGLELARQLAGAARAEGRSQLTEPEALRLVQGLGIAVPRHRVLDSPEAVAAVDLSDFVGDEIVLKGVAASVLHKSELGAVEIVDKSPELLTAAAERMWERLADHAPEGLLLCEYVPYERATGAELLLGMRWTDDFGPIVAVGPGGVESARLAAALDSGAATALVSAHQALQRGTEAALANKSIVRLATREFRGRPARLPLAALSELVERCAAFAEEVMPHDLLELEVNPLALTSRGSIALDAVARIGSGASPAADPSRTPELIARLLEPSSIAIVGVSRRANPGHIILDNILRAGYPRERVTVIKPGLESFEGCRAVPDVASLPEPVDLLVAAVGARQLPELTEQICERQSAKSVILIPGGVGESRGSQERASRIRQTIRRHRAGRGAPVFNGPNCLGVRSRPGNYDTLFIPRHKLAYADGPETPLALLAQSGAFAVARASRLTDLNPRYVVTVGNQIDLTLGDYLTSLAEDPEISVFACYVEGFRPLDGRRFIEAAAAIHARGGAVILYRAGRTESGAEAAASHTASVAGDYAVTRELAGAAGVVVADTLGEFDDLVRLFTALTNAGFESVAIGDSLGSLELASFSEPTLRGLERLLGERRLESIVTPRNPLDVTPIFDDAAFAEVTRLLLIDPGVDLALIGCVPLTGAMSTVPAGDAHGEDVGRPDAVAERLLQLWRASVKPWVAVVDAGLLYDEMARRLAAGGVPTYRTADRALRLLARYCDWQLEPAADRPAG